MPSHFPSSFVFDGTPIGCSTHPTNGLRGTQPMVRAQVHVVCSLLCLAMSVPLVACKSKSADAPEAGAAASSAPPPSVSAAETTPSATATAAPAATVATAAAMAPPPDQQQPLATPPPPPPLVVEPPRPPAPPGFDYWVPGYQRWDGRRYVWERGHWDHRHGRAWAPGHWERRPRGHVSIEGHWD